MEGLFSFSEGIFDSFGIWQLLIISIILSLIGFVRNRIENKGPGNVIDVKGIADLWLAEPSWVSRISLLFIPFGYIINFLSWVVFGIYSLYDFFALIFKLIWWSIVFIWKEIINPGFVSIFRLVWHYFIAFAFYFFKFSFKHIRNSYSGQNLVFSIKYLFVLGLIAAVGLIFYSVIPNIIPLVLFAVLAIFWYQFISIKSASFFKSDNNIEKNISTGMQISAVWFLILVLSSAVLYLFFSYNSSFLISSFGMLFSQVLIPIIILLFIAFFSVTPYLSAFLSNNKNLLKTSEFLKSLFRRAPKLLYAQLFQIPGFLIVGILPVFCFVILNQSTKEISGRDFNEWVDELSSIGDHIPNNRFLKGEISLTESEIREIDKKLVNLKNSFDSDISVLDNKIEEAEELKNNIKDYSIHSYAGDFYVGETQFFSVPFIVECSGYKWVIERNGRIINQKTVGRNPFEKSIIARYTYTSPGEYVVSFSPFNSCGNSPTIKKSIRVLERPVFKDIQRPSGRTSVCLGDEVIFKTERGFDSYEWRYPFGEKTTTDNQIKIVWGNSSGTVQVRGRYKNRFTPWKGLDVYLQPLPNQTDGSSKFLSDESPSVFQIYRDFVFQTREAAQDSIQTLNDIKWQLKEDYENSKELLDNSKNENFRKINSLKSSITDNLKVLIGKYVLLIGFVFLFSFLFSPIFIYTTNYNFELFEFKQEGEHYIESLYNELNSKNPNQPYLALFATLVLLAVIYMLFWTN